MKTLPTALLLTLAALTASAQTSPPTASSPSPGKLAPKPLFTDPVYNNPTDPVITYNAESKKWFMYYTQRRGGSIAQIHGCKIGIATSDDNGATWTYAGTADITYGQDQHKDDYTYWAPEVIWHDGLYHMFLTFVPGIFNDWNHPREIGHLTSKDGIKWDTVGKIDLNSERTIDACVIQLPDNTWRMFYKDEAAPSKHIVTYADSLDLYHWTTKGPAVTDRNGEGEKCFRLGGKYWLMADTDRPEGQAVWSSDDALHWTPQDSTIYGSHGDVVINPVTQRAWWIYFGGQRGGTPNWAVLPSTQPPAPPAPTPTSAPTTSPSTTTPARGRGPGGRGIQINIVELKVVNNKLMYTPPTDPTYVDFGDQREQEK